MAFPFLEQTPATFSGVLVSRRNQEVLRVCPHYTATLYFEGKALLDNPTSSSRQSADAASSAPSSSALFTSAHPPKRVRLTDDTVKQLKDAKDLLDLGVLTQPELEELKVKVLSAMYLMSWNSCRTKRMSLRNIHAHTQSHAKLPNLCQ